MKTTNPPIQPNDETTLRQSLEQRSGTPSPCSGGSVRHTQPLLLDCRGQPKLAKSTKDDENTVTELASGSAPGSGGSDRRRQPESRCGLATIDTGQAPLFSEAIGRAIGRPWG